MKRIVCLLAAAAGVVLGQNNQPEPVIKNPEPVVKNVELTVYLLSGALQGTAPDDVPQDLAPTVKMLHTVFNYKGYKLAESFILRGRSSQSSTEGVLPGSGLHYNFAFNRVRLSPEKPYMVHIDGLRIHITSVRALPVPAAGKASTETTTVASISTELDLAEGQKAVVGKSSINSTGDALFLLVVAKVLE